MKRTDRFLTLHILVMTLALGALAILFTPDAAQAGTCSCSFSGLWGSSVALETNTECDAFDPTCAKCFQEQERKVRCKCWTGCAVMNIGNKCKDGYKVLKNKKCAGWWVFSTKKKKCGRIDTYREEPVCEWCKAGYNKIDGRCEKQWVPEDPEGLTP